MKLTFYGDISLDSIDYQNFQFCDRLKSLIRESNLNIGNLECPITTSEDKEENMAVYMKASPESLSILDGFDVMSLSNNHIRDFRSKGVLDTKFAVKTRGMKDFGVGRNEPEALSPLKIEKDGFKLALIGATRFANSTSKNGYGTGRENHPELFRNIKRLKKEGYFVVPFFHWGYEYVRIPSPRERKIAHRCIDNGADLVIGAHSHIYQCVEEYKGKQIVYSLGNFIFHTSIFEGLSPIPNDPRLHESFAFSVKVNADHTYTSEIHGYSTYDDKVSLYDESENQKLKKDVQDVSDILKSSWVKYNRAYYQQAYEIANQNIKVREKFQKISDKGFIDKLKIYRMANSQDIKNRLAAIAFGLYNKFRG